MEKLKILILFLGFLFPIFKADESKFCIISVYKIQKTFLNIASGGCLGVATVYLLALNFRNVCFRGVIFRVLVTFLVFLSDY